MAPFGRLQARPSASKKNLENFFFLEKIRENFRIFFFSNFPKFFSVDFFHMMCRLRTQSFMTLGQTVRPVCVRTDRQTNLVSNIDLVFKKFSKPFFFIHRYILIKNDIVSKVGEWWSHSFEFFEFYKKHLWGFSFHSMQFCIIFPGFFQPKYATSLCDPTPQMPYQRSLSGEWK